MQEGVIKFELEHRADSLPSIDREQVAPLIGWRELMVRLDLVGGNTGRYHGLGFGNISCRLPPWTRDRVRFLITGSQTGAVAPFTERHVALVESCSPLNGTVKSTGLVPPSSEATTHGAIYQLAPHVRWVFHGHSPEIWRVAEHFPWPRSNPSAGYGTTAMVQETRRLWRESHLSESRLLVMGGHEDGVISFGRTADEAFSVLAGALARSVAKLG